MVWLLPPFTVYVTVAFGVPVKFTGAEPFGQTLVLLEIETKGTGLTVMVIKPDCGWLHPSAPEVATLTSENVVVAV